MKNAVFLLFFLVCTRATFAQKEQTPDSNETRKGLPVLKSYVEPDVVERAKKKFGRLLYSIEKSTAANCEHSYLVGLIKNARLTMQWMCDDPKMVRRSNRKEAVAAKPTGS